MAQIRNVGPGIRTTGQTGGLVYVHLNGKTFSRTLPIMPASMFKTPEALKRQALFTLVSYHMKAHAATIRKAFSKGKYWSPRNNYFHRNAKALYEALDSLAEDYANGAKVSVSQIEQAIAAYATSNPDSIQIGGLDGFAPVYLTGEWPDTITLNSESGDNTTVVIVTSAGSTTHNPGAGSESASYTVTASVLGGNGSVSPESTTVQAGQSVTLTATPESGYRVKQWSNGDTSASITVTPTANTAYTVEFEATSGGGGGDTGGGDMS